MTHGNGIVGEMEFAFRRAQRTDTERGTDIGTGNCRYSAPYLH